MGQTVITHAPKQETVICTHFLTLGRPDARLAEAIMRERMRLCKRDFRRGMAHDYAKRSARLPGFGRRLVLPLVSV